MKQENLTIKTIRVIATISIVLCHIIKYYSFIPGSNKLSQFFDVGVPLFIICSGWLYGKKALFVEENTSVKTFCKNRFIRVCIPCQIWAVICFICSFGKYLFNTAITIMCIQGFKWIFPFSNFPHGGPYLAHTWFVTIIMLCYFITPILNKVHRYLNNMHVVIIYICCLLLTLIGVDLTYISLFVVSYYFALKDYEYDSKEKYLGGLLFVGIALRVIGYLLFDNIVFYSGVICNLSWHMMALAIIVIIHYSLRSQVILKLSDSKISTHINKYSYSIYLTHYSVIKPIYNELNIIAATIMFFSTVFIVSIFHEKFCGVIISKIKKHSL